MPPLASLRAFEAVARLGQVAAAAQELSVTPGAITQHVRRLEEHLGTQLTQKDGRGIAVTDAGAKLALGLRRGFAELREAVDAVSEAVSAKPVTITTTPTFATYWLMPRFAALRAAFPELNLAVLPTPALVNVATGEADLGVRFGVGDWPELTSHKLIDTGYIAVAAPSLVGQGELTVEELSNLPWFAEAGSAEVERILAQSGAPFCKPSQVTSLPANLAIEAVRRGEGALVAADVFVQDDIAAGRLRVVSTALRAGTAYHLIHQQGPLRAPVRAVRDWFLREAKKKAEH